MFAPKSQFSIEIDRKIELLNMTFFFTLLFLTPYTIIAYTQGKYWLNILEVAALISMIVLYFYLRRTGNIVVAGNITTGFLGILFLYLIADGGVEGTGPLWSFSFPVLLPFLHGSKRGTRGMVIFMAVILFMFFLPGTPLMVTAYSFDFKIRFLTSLLVIFCFSNFSESVRAHTQDRITAKADELTKTLNSLKASEEEKNRLHEELLAARKIEAIGTLAGGMAHEFNNQVSVILGNTELLLNQLQGDASMDKKLTAIKNASERIASLTDQLLSFSRKQILKMETVDMQTLVKRAGYAIDNELGKHVCLMIEQEPDTHLVEVDPIQIIQVIMDLVQNARDAMAGQENGKVTITIKNAFFPEGMDAATHIKNGSYVCLSVQDTGIGMNSDTLAKIYDPFFTTKNPGQGTGLGLSFVYGTVKQHNGWMDVTSEPGKGTTISIYLPAKKETNEG